MKIFRFALIVLSLGIFLLLPFQAQASGTSILVLTIDGAITPATPINWGLPGPSNCALYC
jgi:membrane-bound ClpP family serine protease